MTIKIKKGSEAEKSLEPLLKEKQRRQNEFREAVQKGDLDAYAKKQGFAQPIPVSKP